jgi:hypothetical protein
MSTSPSQMAQTARRQLPDNPNTADTLGWAFYHKAVYGSAITLFKEAVKTTRQPALQLPPGTRLRQEQSRRCRPGNNWTES